MEGGFGEFLELLPLLRTSSSTWASRVSMRCFCAPKMLTNSPTISRASSRLCGSGMTGSAGGIGDAGRRTAGNKSELEPTADQSVAEVTIGLSARRTAVNGYPRQLLSHDRDESEAAAVQLYVGVPLPMKTIHPTAGSNGAIYDE